MRDLHQVVIHDIRQMVCRQLVCTLEEHLIIKDVRLHTHLTTNEVVDENLLSTVNLKTHHILLTVGYQLLHFLLRQRQRVTHHITGVTVVLEILDLSALRLQLLRGVESDIRLIVIQQLLHIFLIYLTTLTLTVGTFVAAKAHALVKLDTQPLERLQDILLGTWYKTVRIRILNTEHKLTAMLACKQIVIQGSAHTADMEGTRRTGCKSHSYSSF